MEREHPAIALMSDTTKKSLGEAHGVDQPKIATPISGATTETADPVRVTTLGTATGDQLRYERDLGQICTE